MTATDYAAFLAEKQRIDRPTGFDAQDVCAQLFPFQQAIVKWACRRGRAAIFADCGLGKTGMQLEWARQVAEHTGGKVLILAPLAVASQTVREAEKFGIGGVGSEGFEAVKAGRRFLGIELKESYFKQACANLRIASQSTRQRSLFGATEVAL